jgi:TetR/AcrR family transcriptional regulator, cholesterol catabolism regulator
VQANDRSRTATQVSPAAAPSRTTEESTHQRVARIAAETFARKGFHGTGVAEIGDSAGVKRGALYYHIRSKEYLLYEISKGFVEEAIAEAAAILQQEDNPLLQLRLLARALVLLNVNRHSELVVWLREGHALAEEHQVELRLLRDEYEFLWSKALASGAATGLLRPCDPIDVKGLIGMISYTYIWLRPGELTSGQIADQLMDIFLRGIALPGVNVELTKHSKKLHSRSTKNSAMPDRQLMPPG